MIFPFIDFEYINLSNNFVRKINILYNYHKHCLNKIFKKPKRFEAINGNNVKIPEYWSKYNTYTKYYPHVSMFGAYGCYQSHYQIYKNFVLSTKNYILIIEDDLEFNNNFVEEFIKIYSCLPKDWDVLYLSYTNNQPPLKINKYLNKVTSCNLLSCYLLNKKGAQKYIDFLDKIKDEVGFICNEPIDCQLSRIQHKMNVYQSIKPLAYQGVLGKQSNINKK